MALVTLTRERIGPVWVRSAYINATGEHLVASEHNAILCRPEALDGVMDGLVTLLRARGTDMLRLCGFTADAAAAVRRCWPAGPQDGFESEDRYVPLADLRGRSQTYLQSLSKKTRQQIKRAAGLYEQQHGALQLHRVTDLDGARACFAELSELHLRRIADRGATSPLADDRARRFHDSLFTRCFMRDESAADQGLNVDFFRVRYGDFTIGLLYLLRFRSRIDFYQSGFRYSADRLDKPGFLTNAFAIQHYLDAGFEEYDFLAGDAGPVQYKTSLGAAVRPLVWWDLSAPTLRTHALHTLRQVGQRLRRLAAAS
jgi:CelD/BcsL family acetyltransferase involved in cellulose biosynthesis